MDTLEARFQEDAYPIHSFPELSVASWLFKDSGTSVHPYATSQDVQDVDPDDGEILPDEIDANMKSLLPKFDDLMIPLLEHLSDEKEHLASEVYQKLKCEAELEKYDVITLESTGQPLFDNRAAWAKSYLKRAELVDFPRRGYEKGIAGFYDVVLSGKGWRVDAGKTIGWLIESKTPGIDKILPSMRTDIILDHSGEGRRIVIDTKFNSVVTRGWYREETLRSGYVYQIYAYLRSQEGNDDRLAANASGLLLHPSVGDMVDEAVVIQNHEIRFATVDLRAKAKEIRQQLLQVIEASHAS